LLTVSPGAFSVPLMLVSPSTERLPPMLTPELSTFMVGVLISPFTTRSPFISTFPLWVVMVAIF
jgi:hypothetical protein